MDEPLHPTISFARGHNTDRILVSLHGENKIVRDPIELQGGVAVHHPVIIVGISRNSIGRRLEVNLL
jgi:hypothetical protein